MARSISYCLYREDRQFVAQCLNVDVSSFGDSPSEALQNLREALELYFEEQDGADFLEISEAVVGEEVIGA